jgi:hypothetical protein
MIDRWGMEVRVKENLKTLHTAHRLRILNERLLYHRGEL